MVRSQGEGYERTIFGIFMALLLLVDRAGRGPYPALGGRDAWFRDRGISMLLMLQALLEDGFN